MTYQKLIKTGQKLAKNAGLEEEAIKLLVLELSGLDGAEFFMNLNSEIDIELEAKINKAIEDYLSGIPAQHIIGYSYFYGYKMIVNSNVLIPRPETEELVGLVLSYYDDLFDGKKVDVVDVGTGSGNIAIALAKEEANMTLTATDISNEALETAKSNALNNDANVTFLQGNMLDPLIEKGMKFDILVSNPPYIPDDEYVDPLVKDNEPNIALFGGDKGMKFYKEILENASKILNPNALLCFEHSHKTRCEMLELANRCFPNAKAEVLKDLQGKDRFLVIINGDFND